MIRLPPRSTLFPYTTPSDLLYILYIPYFWNNIYFLYILFNKLFQSIILDIKNIATMLRQRMRCDAPPFSDRKSTRLNSSHTVISYAVFCLKKKKKKNNNIIY